MWDDKETKGQNNNLFIYLYKKTFNIEDMLGTCWEQIKSQKATKNVNRII